MNRHGLTADRLRQVVRYDPETGLFRWVDQSWQRWRAEVGHVNAKDGYRRIWIDGRLYTAQRLAWLYMTGEWPELDLDHINRRRADNRWTNLRSATRSANIKNHGGFRTNTSGTTNVSYDKSKDLWKVFTWPEPYKRRYLGGFRTKAEAVRFAASSSAMRSLARSS